MTRTSVALLILTLSVLSSYGEVSAQSPCDFSPKVGELPVESGEAVQVASIPAITDGEFIHSLVLTNKRLIAAPHPDVPGPMDAPDDATIFSSPLRSFPRSDILSADYSGGNLNVTVRFRRGSETKDRKLMFKVCTKQEASLRALVKSLNRK